MTPIITFWIILMVAATYMASMPISSPAATTDPVLSTVPPIQAPAHTGCMPVILAMVGSKKIITATKIMDIPMDRVSSSFLAPLAEALAMAAETPDTHISEETVMLSSLE